jgi:hypothetical protein
MDFEPKSKKRSIRRWKTKTKFISRCNTYISYTTSTFRDGPEIVTLPGGAQKYAWYPVKFTYKRLLEEHNNLWWLRDTPKTCSNPLCCGNARAREGITRKEKEAKLSFEEQMKELQNGKSTNPRRQSGKTKAV